MGGTFALLTIWCGQALFEFGVGGVDLGGAVIFVEIQFGDLAFLLGDLFHLTFL